jgi:hypothetical protein
MRVWNDFPGVNRFGDCAGHGQDSVAGVGLADNGRGALYSRAHVPQGLDQRGDALQRYLLFVSQYILSMQSFELSVLFAGSLLENGVNFPASIQKILIS